MKIISTLMFVGLILGQTGSTSAIEVKIPAISESEELDRYKIDLLTLILEKSGVEFVITQSSAIKTQARIIAEMKTGSDKIDLNWMGTSKELENDLLPIRFPIYRGLLGHRIFIIHKDDHRKFEHVRTLADLKKFTGAQGLGWTDIDILEHAGLKQYITAYEKIFKLVNAGRVDYFSRGISEAFVEVESRKAQWPNLDLEQNIMLVYPFAMFFFTSPSNKELARILEDGFRKAYEDGSFTKYFYNHPDIKKLFKQANIEHRNRIEIPNPLLTKETANIPDRFWHGR